MEIFGNTPSEVTRRRFLEFMGRGAGTLAGASVFGPLVARSTPAQSASDGVMRLKPIKPSFEDKLMLAEGFSYNIIARYGDTLNRKGEKFGYNCDYTAFFPIRKGAKDDGVLWVNHEYPHMLLTSGHKKGTPRTRAEVEKEMDTVGGSLIRVRRNSKGEWETVKNDPMNRRITARTKIPFAWHEPIYGSKTAVGTLANCAGGVTPWGTVLSCEENYQDFYVERGGKPSVDYNEWEPHVSHPPEHYGWVVEVNPFTGKAKKLVAMGRFGHEGATIVQAADGRCVAYQGDDRQEECLYKFIADKPGTLERGTLYVANMEEGKWIPLDLEKTPLLKEHFKSQTEVLIGARKASKLVGGTRLARPEDIEYDAVSKSVFVALTNLKSKGDYMGRIMRLREKNNDPLSLEFEHETFLAGGPGKGGENGFACPDNMAFDHHGNLWITTDMSGRDIGGDTYGPFGNNGLFFIPLRGKNAGKVYQIASGPKDSEFTGPYFSPDGKTLFLSVQHPGEETTDLNQVTSHWPDGGASLPLPSVVAISVPAFDLP